MHCGVKERIQILLLNRLLLCSYLVVGTEPGTGYALVEKKKKNLVILIFQETTVECMCVEK